MPKARARAPGKVILCGEHAVVHGSAAVAAAIGLYTRVEIAEGADTAVLCLRLVDVDLTLEWPVEGIRELLKLHEADPMLVNPCSEEVGLVLRDLVKECSFPASIHRGLSSGVVAFLFLYSSIVGLKSGAIVTIDSDIPMGCGLGSSAAFSVALAASLLACTRECRQEPVQGGDWSSISEAEADLINRWAFESEKIIHGKPSGIDNTVSTFGKVVKYKQGDITPVGDISSLRVLITNTKVARDTKQLVSNVYLLKKRHPKFMPALFQAVDYISEEVIGILQSLNGTDTSKNSHMTDQSHGLPSSQHENDLENLVAMNQALLEAMFVSHSSIREICSITAKYNLKSKLTGAGGGGCVITLLPRALPEEVFTQVKTELTGNGYECFETDIGVEGVQLRLSRD